MGLSCIKKRNIQPACQLVEKISLFNGNVPPNLVRWWDWAWDIPSKHYLFNFQPLKQLKPLKHKYILTTTKLGSLSRVLFNRGSHMFINGEGPTQRSIATVFWNVGVDEFGNYYILLLIWNWQYMLLHILLYSICIYIYIYRYIYIYILKFHNWVCQS